MSTTLAIPTPQGIALRHEFDVADVIAQVKKIQLVMEQVMKEGEHYGVIPGTNKPSLLKPGAEKLLLTFRFDPQYESTETYEGKHLTVKSKCILYHIPTGLRMGSGEGSCSTKEAKYAYRKGQRLCTDCGADTIRADRNDGGWYCWRKIGGCGAKFKAGDKNIESQQVERVPNEDLADQYNTVLKMANKRALVAAVLNVTAASDIFTQDMEDLHGGEAQDAAASRGSSGSATTIAAPTNSKPTRAAETPTRGGTPSQPNTGVSPMETTQTFAPQPARESMNPFVVDATEEEARRLFPDPQDDVERERLLNDIFRMRDTIAASKTTPKEKKTWETDRKEAWITYVGDGVSPSMADLAALADVKKWLETRMPK